MREARKSPLHPRWAEIRPSPVGVKAGKAQCEQMFSAVASIADIAQRSQDVRFVPQTDSCTAAKLFDHLVGLHEQRGRHGEVERIRGLTINDEFELRRQLDG